MSHPLTLDGLLALCDKATPGPWGWGWRNDTVAPGSIHAPINAGYAAIAMCPRYGKEQFKKDAPYIAALSPEVVAALVRCVQAADAMRATLPNIPRTQHGCIARRAEFDVARAALDAALRGKP